MYAYPGQAEVPQAVPHEVPVQLAPEPLAAPSAAPAAAPAAPAPDPAPAAEPSSPPEHIPLSVHQMSATNALGGSFGLGLDQFELPKAPVAKIARSEMPESMQLRKEVNTALVKSASVFVSYLTAAAHDVASAKGSKTIGAPHVLDALRELEFPPALRRELRAELAAFRELQKDKADAARERRAKAREAGRGDGEDADADVTMEEAEAEAEPTGDPSA